MTHARQACAAPLRLVITGATGFIGTAVMSELARVRGEESGSASLHLRVVGRAASRAAAAGDEWVRADLSDPGSLRECCAGADVLLHLASVIGSDERQCAAVNTEGTAALMAQARRAGVGRIVHLSTAAVYGQGPHRGIAVDGVAPAPVSATSRTRLAGEGPALAAGAVVLRPSLVIGAGDRWVVPGLGRLLEATGAMWGGGRALLSLVAVGDLARLVVRLALGHGPDGGSVWHASHPEPVAAGALVRALTGRGILAPVERDLPEAECLERLAASGSRMSPRQFWMLAQDHWYDSAGIWEAAGCTPGPGPLACLDEAGFWYREYMGRAGLG
ncbi:NAD-dependent epimerase/dehydratase family protein [Streptomyces sp. IBSNAI002]|uniref:NAD-dependent epimerase/dehydratase family protein n=1 Tax=Streptomyces sp. IBSNAI002 TaxID=3457500 RepID=UPI003FD47DFD